LGHIRSITIRSASTVSWERRGIGGREVSLKGLFMLLTDQGGLIIRLTQRMGGLETPQGTMGPWTRWIEKRRC
jgi:hypothetical protein